VRGISTVLTAIGIYATIHARPITLDQPHWLSSDSVGCSPASTEELDHFPPSPRSSYPPSDRISPSASAITTHYLRSGTDQLEK
jgi:hypothetical protein